MKIIPSWTIPMYAFEPWEHHQTHQSELIDICYNLQQNKNQSGVAPGVKNLYESDFDFFQQDHPAVKALLEYCRSAVFEAANHANRGRWEPGARIGVDMHEAWCHITQSGGYHDAHTHPNSSWSGIYYIRAGESDLSTKNGVNRFYAPWMPTAYSDVGTMWNSQLSSIDMPAEDGSLIIFPSWILHSGMPYYGTVERVVVAFNCKFIQG
jgi:hypothetical protein